jgi:hypothetical protein
MALAKFPKPNHLRLRITIHRLKHGSEIAASYTDGNGITHRTPFMRNQKQAETKLKEWAQGVTGLAMISFVITAETIEEKGDR